jgi:C1A family cysteine protease
MILRSSLYALLSTFAFVAIAGSSELAQGAPVAAPAKAVTKPAPVAKLVPAVIAIEVKAPPALLKVIAKKQVFDVKALEPALTYTTNRLPRLKLASGKQVILQAPVEEPPIAASAKTLARGLATQLTKYQKYTATSYYGKARLIASLVAKAVDHRSNQTPIRDQADRGTCVAHASVAAIEAIYKKRDGVTKDLSENYAYNMFMQKEGSTCMADAGLSTWKAAGYLTTDHICEESQSPYVTTTAASCATVQPVCQSHRVHGNLTTSTFFAPAFGGTGNDVATNTNYLESLLDAGNDVVMGVYLAGNDWHNGVAESGAVDVQVLSNGNPAGAYGGHAMLMVGYSKAGNYFIFKNSWGTAVGHSGYFYLTYEYLQTYAKYGYVVSTATPS